jgi:hypothetical protein
MSAMEGAGGEHDGGAANDFREVGRRAAEGADDHATRCLAALERQARREEMSLGELVECVPQDAAKRVLIEESVRSIELGSLCDDDLLIEHGFDIGGGDA